MAPNEGRTREQLTASALTEEGILDALNSIFKKLPPIHGVQISINAQPFNYDHSPSIYAIYGCMSDAMIPKSIYVCDLQREGCKSCHCHVRMLGVECKDFF